MKEILRSSYREVPVSEGSSYQELTVVSGIPDSLSCIPDSKAHDSGFHNSNGFQWDSVIKTKMYLKLYINSLILCFGMEVHCVKWYLKWA